VQGDAYALPFADASFDCAFSGFFLSHVPPERVSVWLAEVRRVLRPGGSLLIFDSLLPEGREDVQVQRRPLKDGSQHRVLKVYYTPATLTRALAAIAPRGAIACATTGRYFVHARVTTR
jgi:demethylmenaquinone methyltransferase/2-methoxy-6-polyprenyl-1,4-benzoquinol methylase